MVCGAAYADGAPMGREWRMPSRSGSGPSWSWGSVGPSSNWNLDLSWVEVATKQYVRERNVFAKVEFCSDPSPLPRGWGHTGTNPAIWLSYPQLDARHRGGSNLSDHHPQSTTVDIELTVVPSEFPGSITAHFRIRYLDHPILRPLSPPSEPIVTVPTSS